jgi:deoxyribonucleoside regulator
MDKEKQHLCIEAARLYYQSDFSQQQIATRLGISRPTVSRLLQYAKDKGYVQITVADPFLDIKTLEQQLIEKYQLKEAHVVFSPAADYPTVKEYLSKSGAEYLEEVVTDNTILGISWGSTLYEVAKKMEMQPVKGVQVVQLKGSISYSNVNTYAWETLMLFSQAFQTLPSYLPLPLVFEHTEMKKMVESDRNIHHIIKLGKQANMAVFTVGTVRDEALLFRLGYFSEEEIRFLQKKAVGDICSRFIDMDGQICSEEINNRTISIELKDLCEKEKSILIAGGEQKTAAMHGALKGCYANVLITDQYTASRLLLL